MFPFFLKSIVEDSLKNERNMTPVNIFQCKHLRTGFYKLAQTQQKRYTIEFVGCDVVWNYSDMTSRNVEYELIVNNQFNNYISQEENNLKPMMLND